MEGGRETSCEGKGGVDFRPEATPVQSGEVHGEVGKRGNPRKSGILDVNTGGMKARCGKGGEDQGYWGRRVPAILGGMARLSEGLGGGGWKGKTGSTTV